MMWFPLSLFFFLFVFVSRGNYHDAIASLNFLLRADEEVVKILDQYLDTTTDEAVTKIIKRYIRTSKKFTKIVDSGIDPFHHPINGFHFLKHLVYNWKEVYSAIKTDSAYSYEPVISAIMRQRDTNNHPSSQDVSYAAASISRMQYVYNISMKELVQGKIGNGADGIVFQSIKPLNSWDCNVIGEGSMLLEQTESAMEWFNIAKDKVMSGGDLIDIGTILENEKETTLLKSWVYSSKETIEKNWDELLRKRDNSSYTQDIFRHGRTNLRLPEFMTALCRGEATKIKFPKPKLSCKYFTRDHAFFKLGPLKLEEISGKPAIVLFHNFMMEEEMEKLVEMSERNLQSSIHPRSMEKLDPHVLTCTSKRYKIPKNHPDEIHAKISRRIEAALGVGIINLSTQVKNYGIAGAYTPHADIKEGFEKLLHDLYPSLRLENRALKDLHTHVEVRDSVANLMTYAGNVTYGGSTVFPLAGVSVSPERGAALLWFNYNKNGEGDMLSLHVSCPIIYGSKWIINNWIDRKEQMFTLPCGSNSQDRFQLIR